MLPEIPIAASNAIRAGVTHPSIETNESDDAHCQQASLSHGKSQAKGEEGAAPLIRNRALKLRLREARRV